MKKIISLLFLVTSISLSSDLASQERPDIKKAKALLLMNEGKNKEALVLLESIKDQVNTSDYLFMLGVAYQKNGRYKDSADILRQYASIKPNDEEYHYYLGYALYNLKEYALALDEFNKSDLFGVKTDASSYYSGMINFEKKEYALALPFFIKASKEGGEYENVAHYYAGICLYKDGIGEGGFSSLDASLYHFEKVLKDNSEISEDAKRYIEIIREYIDTGAIRQKKRLELKFRAELFYTNDRSSGLIDGIPALGIDSDQSSYGGDFMIDVAASPIMYDEFAVFLSYGFSEDLGFDPNVKETNVQKHLPGISFQFFNEGRTMEGRLDYRYELNYLDSDKARKIDFAHAITPSYINSFNKNWAMGIKIPFRIHNGTGGVWGDFSAKSFEVVIMSYHLLGRTTLRLEPSLLFFLPSSSSSVSKFNYYSFNAKANLPWEILVVRPGLKLGVGWMSRSVGNSNAVYDLGLSLFRPLGLGSKIELMGTLRKGYISDDWEFISGLAFEYVY